MTAEQDFRRLLDRFGAPRVRMDVESGLYSPIRLAWARAWLADEGAEGESARPKPQTPASEPAPAEVGEARRLASEANELSAEANRMAREAKALARSSQATARSASMMAAAAIIAAIAAAGAVGTIAFHLF